MSTVGNQIIELVAKNRHDEMVIMGIDNIPWDQKPKDYRKQLIRAEKKRQKKLNREMGMNFEPMVIEGDDKPRKKGKKNKKNG